MTAVVVGSTGLVGSHILSTLLNTPKYTAVHAFCRRPLAQESSKLQLIQSTDSESWPKSFPTSPAPSAFFSGLGTTRAQAGGLAEQRKIDYDLNLNLAKAAKEAGVDTYVLISSGGASSSSMMPYMKMKGELEDDVQKLGFKHTVILRPGLILGQREKSRTAEYLLQQIASGLGAVSSGLKDSWAQDASVIAKAAVNAGLQCEEGKREPGVWIVDQKELVQLGKDAPEK